MSKNKPTIEEIFRALEEGYSKKRCEEILKHASIKDLAEAEKRLDEPEKKTKKNTWDNGYE